MSESNIILTNEARVEIAKLLGLNINLNDLEKYHRIFDDAIRKSISLNIKNVKNQVETTLFDDNSIRDPQIRNEIINQKNQILRNLSETELLEYLNSGPRQYNSLFDDFQSDGAIINVLKNVINSKLDDYIEPTKTNNLSRNLEIPEFINKYGTGLFQNILIRDLTNKDTGNIDYFIDYVNQVQIGRSSFLTNLMGNNLPGVDTIINNQIELSNKGKDSKKYSKYSTKEIGKDINLDNIRQVPDLNGVDEYVVNGVTINGDQGIFNYSEQINEFSNPERIQVDIQNDIQLPNIRTGNGYLINLGEPTNSAGQSLTPFIGQTQFIKNDLSFGFDSLGKPQLPVTFNLINELSSDSLPLSVQSDSDLGKEGFIFLKQTIQNRIDRSVTKEIQGRVGNITDAMDDPLGAGVALLKGQSPPFTLSYDITTLPGFLTAFDITRRISGIDPGISPIPEENIGSSVVNSIKNGINTLFGRNIFGGDINDCDTNPDKLVPPKLPRNKTLLRYTSTGQLFKMYNTISYNKFTPEWLRDPDTLDLLSTLIPKPKSNLYIDSQRKYTTSQKIGGVLGIPIKEPDSNYILDNTDPVRLSDSPDNSGLGDGKLSDNFVEYDTNADGTGEGGRINTITIKPGESDDIYWETNEVLRNNTNFGNPRITSDDSFREDGQTWDGSINISGEFSFNGDSILCSTQSLANRDDIIGDVVRNSTRSYRGMSKGNAVKWPMSSVEYCRVWTKDRNYNQVSDLVRKGYTRGGRGLMSNTKYTTLDKNGIPTFAPYKNDPELNDVTAKRYMLSIENLAWRGSKVFLPCGEVGPNGGRIMWFPPYNISFTDNGTANWTENTFMGRPEPIYTYNNSSRSGTLDFDLVVDHPSIVNHFNNPKYNVNGYGVKPYELEAFFADCVNYPVEDLLQKYKELTVQDLTYLQSILNKNVYTLDLIYSGSPKIYFDNDLPGSCTDKPIVDVGPDGGGCDPNYFWGENKFDSEYQRYIGRYSTYLNNNSDSSNKSVVDLYFGSNGIIQKGYEDINLLITLIKEKIKDYKDKGQTIAKVTMVIESNTSLLNKSKSNYNNNLSSRRYKSLENYIKSKIKSTFPEISVEIKPNELKEAASSSVVSTPVIDVNNSQYTNPNVETVSVYSPGAFQYRYAAVIPSSIKLVLVGGDEVPLSDGLKQENDTLNKQVTYLNELNRRLQAGVIQPYNKECEMFETLEANSKFLYDSLIEKLKFFHPSFHSTTPEGFNSRLTFLQQCLRPGDSIDTTVVTNTVFGPPPICILRIGDFYHTKIVINTINVTYDPLVWDMNYEGIGMQPMIAKISIGFNYIGGSSLGGPITELQNALTFNYFANTNLYDSRAKLSQSEEDYLNSVLEQQRKQERVELEKIQKGETTPQRVTPPPTSDQELVLNKNVVNTPEKVTPGLTRTGGSGQGAVLENQNNNSIFNF